MKEKEQEKKGEIMKISLIEKKIGKLNSSEKEKKLNHPRGLNIRVDFKTR